jgi:hypothetical protein
VFCAVARDGQRACSRRWLVTLLIIPAKRGNLISDQISDPYMVLGARPRKVAVRVSRSVANSVHFVRIDRGSDFDGVLAVVGTF